MSKTETIKRKPGRVRAGRVWAKPYPLMLDAIEQGAATGLRRATKHTDTPDAQTVADTVEEDILQAICDRFDFETYDDL